MEKPTPAQLSVANREVKRLIDIILSSKKPMETKQPINELKSYFFSDISVAMEYHMQLFKETLEFCWGCESSWYFKLIFLTFFRNLTKNDFQGLRSLQDGKDPKKKNMSPLDCFQLCFADYLEAGREHQDQGKLLYKKLVNQYHEVNRKDFINKYLYDNNEAFFQAEIKTVISDFKNKYNIVLNKNEMEDELHKALLIHPEKILEAYDFSCSLDDWCKNTGIRIINQIADFLVIKMLEKKGTLSYGTLIFCKNSSYLKEIEKGIKDEWEIVQNEDITAVIMTYLNYLGSKNRLTAIKQSIRKERDHAPYINLFPFAPSVEENPTKNLQCHYEEGVNLKTQLYLSARNYAEKGEEHKNERKKLAKLLINPDPQIILQFAENAFIFKRKGKVEKTIDTKIADVLNHIRRQYCYYKNRTYSSAEEFIGTDFQEDIEVAVSASDSKRKSDANQSTGKIDLENSIQNCTIFNSFDLKKEVEKFVGDSFFIRYDFCLSLKKWCKKFLGYFIESKPWIYLQQKSKGRGFGFDILIKQEMATSLRRLIQKYKVEGKAITNLEDKSQDLYQYFGDETKFNPDAFHYDSNISTYIYSIIERNLIKSLKSELKKIHPELKKDKKTKKQLEEEKEAKEIEIKKRNAPKYRALLLVLYNPKYREILGIDGLKKNCELYCDILWDFLVDRTDFTKKEDSEIIKKWKDLIKCYHKKDFAKCKYDATHLMLKKCYKELKVINYKNKSELSPLERELKSEFNQYSQDVSFLLPIEWLRLIKLLKKNRNIRGYFNYDVRPLDLSLRIMSVLYFNSERLSEPEQAEKRSFFIKEIEKDDSIINIYNLNNSSEILAEIEKLNERIAVRIINNISRLKLKEIFVYPEGDIMEILIKKTKEQLLQIESILFHDTFLFIKQVKENPMDYRSENEYIHTPLHGMDNYGNMDILGTYNDMYTNNTGTIKNDSFELSDAIMRELNIKLKEDVLEDMGFISKNLYNPQKVYNEEQYSQKLNTVVKAIAKKQGMKEHDAKKRCEEILEVVKRAQQQIYYITNRVQKIIKGNYSKKPSELEIQIYHNMVNYIDKEFTKIFKRYNHLNKYQDA